MRITLYEQIKDPRPLDALDLTWAGLTDCLSEAQERDEKDGPLWSPHELAPGQGRGNAAVIWVTAAVFDLDHVTEEQLAACLERLKGVEYIIHTTHSHTPEDFRARLVLSLSRPVRAIEWPQIHAAIVRKFDIPADAACKDAARAYYLPAKKPGAEFLFDSVAGAPVDVGALRVGEHAARPVVRVPPADRPPADDAVCFDAADIRKRIQASIRGQEKTELRNILDGTPLATQGARDVTLNRTMSQLAWRVSPGTPWEALLPVVRDSIVRMEHLPGEDWLATAESQYHRAQERHEVFRADERRRHETLISALKDKVAGTKPSLIPVEVQWVPEERLLVKWTKEGMVPEHCTQNAITVFREHPDCAGHIRFNTLTRSIEVTGGILKSYPLSTLPTWAGAYLYTQHGIRIPSPAVKDALLATAQLNQFNPVAEWLVSLEWDGKERIDTMLETYFGASTEGDIAEHVRRVSAKFMISAVARGMEPGCQVDTTLVIEGPQGSGKTSAFRVLGGPWYMSASAKAGNDKDANMVATRGWIVELAELASFRQADAQTIKAFLDKTIDSFRPPYGAAIEDFARPCVFVGTTNDDAYLTDRTGNRRYWPVACPGKVDVEGLKRDREQLFAEAVERYRAGERWHLEGEELAFADQVAEERVAEDENLFYCAQVEKWWERIPVERRKALRDARELTTLFMGEKALGLDANDVTRAVSIRLGHSMKMLGWKKGHGRAVGHLRYYTPPQDWIDRPVKTLSLEKKP